MIVNTFEKSAESPVHEGALILVASAHQEEDGNWRFSRMR